METMSDTEDFDTLAFEKKLMQLQGTQDSIQGMSSWCLKRKDHHKKIVQSWLNVLKRVKVDQRLVLFYLANDVIQYSKRKGYDFVESWGLNLQKATPLVRDEKVRPKILRIFKIWEQRSVYDEEFLSDLNGLLSAGAIKRTDDDPSDFQPQQLINKIKQCTVLESDTDQKLRNIHDCPLDLDDTEELCASLKERCHKDDVMKEITEGVTVVELYTQALQREIVAREALLALLSSANQYYSTQRGEVKVVAYAYKNFGARVRALKRKLEELTPKLSAAPSPPREQDVPSPGPDEDIDLPATDGDIAYNIDKTFNTSISADGSLYNLGLSTFLGSDNPMSLFNDSIDNDSNKIEVISSNKPPDFDINNFLKSLGNNDSTASDDVSVSSQTLPGLDPSPEVPVTLGSFYGTNTTQNDEPDARYDSNANSPWTPVVANPWTLPPAPVPPVPLPVPAPARLRSPPQSPPHVHHVLVPPPVIVKEIPTDVDHRGLLPPPPPPPVLSMLGQIEDVDHRMLPTLPPPPPPPVTPVTRTNNAVKDIDHRNLISLTDQLARSRDELPLPLRSDGNIDQDYRVPPPIQPSDIVESVDMDLSEDDERSEQNQNYDLDQRHKNFHNNKVLVGGPNGKMNLDPRQHFNRTNNVPEKPFNREHSEPTPPHIAPLIPNLEGFDRNRDYDYTYQGEEVDEMEEGFEEDWQPPGMPPRFPNQRFPRNWTSGARPRFPPQFWPRNGPRPPNRPWMGPRPQRFW